MDIHDIIQMVSSRAHYPKQNIIFLRPDVKFSKKEYALHSGLFWYQKVEYLEKTKHTVKNQKIILQMVFNS